MGFIFRASIGLFWKRSIQKLAFPPPHENSNNPLAAEPESENDAVRFFPKGAFDISLWLKRRLPATTKGFIQMINTLTRARKLGPLLAAAIFATAAPALAQAPSQAQRDAIKSQCRSDYMAHCSSVPPGGEASLQCLQKNMSSLSSSCQSAVRAVAAPAAAPAKPAETAAPKAAAPAAATTTAPQSCRAKGCSRCPCGTADQRTDFRYPQRLPLRLSEGLRGRADRRRARPAMPGKEQGETLGRLRESRLRRQRRCSASGSARGRRGSGRSGSGCCRCTGGADRDRAAADAAA